MLKVVRFLILSLIFLLGSKREVWAHFLTIITEDFYYKEPKTPVKLEVLFTHPIEKGPHMAFKIEEAQLKCGEEKISLTWQERKLKSKKGVEGTSFVSSFLPKRPALCTLYVKESPYFETSEGRFIQQVAQVIFSFYGFEEGWDKPTGLPVEIVPQIKPFSLYEGNTFVGQVLIDGKPASKVEIEVEFLNTYDFKVPHDGFVPQVLKTDERGYFVYTFPFPGLWGFSAITEKGTLKGKDGKDYPLELDGVLWLKVYPKPKRK